MFSLSVETHKDLHGKRVHKKKVLGYFHTKKLARQFQEMWDSGMDEDRTFTIEDLGKEANEK